MSRSKPPVHRAIEVFNFLVAVLVIWSIGKAWIFILSVPPPDRF